MTHDILDQLARLRPDAGELERRWPAESRAELADRIVRDDLGTSVRLHHLPTSRRTRSRRVRLFAASTVVAAAVATALAVPTLLPHGAPGAAGPAAAALLDLSRTAAVTPAISATGGQLVHTIMRDHQVGIPENPEDGQVAFGGRTEDWTAPDGSTWRRESGTDPSGKRYADIDYLPSGHSNDIHAYLAKLPTRIDDLQTYLRRTVHGSSSTDEAVFGAIGGILADPLSSAELRSAAIGVLARTNHVRLSPTTRDALGREVTQFDFVDETIRPGQVQTLSFDPRTALVIDISTTQPGSSYSSSVLLSEVVDAVPARIQRSAVVPAP